MVQMRVFKSHVCIQYVFLRKRVIPDISSVLPAVKSLGPHAFDFAPVAGIDALVCETTRLSEARVVAGPEEHHSVQPERPPGVLDFQGVVDDIPSVLPEEEIVHEHMHQRREGRGLLGYTLKARISTLFRDLPELVGVQESEVDELEFRRQVVRQVGTSQGAGSHGPGTFVLEHRNTIAHADDSLVPGVSGHRRVGGDLRDVWNLELMVRIC